MEPEIDLPFKEGQLAESRSFEKGYRGAWFKCQIINISRRRGRLGHVLKYLDFPGEKLKWTMLYHVTSNHDGDAKLKHSELILRPPYPPIYDERKMPRVSEISEVSVIVGDSWRVGDLVDWWTTGCYWSGRITQILGPNKAKIELNPPPLGEGESYTVLCNDLRPSLDWSPELGWTMPTQKGGRPCARLIFPINQEMQTQSISQQQDRQERSRSQGSADSSTRKLKEKQERTEQGWVNSRPRKISRVVADSGQNGAEEELNSDSCQESRAILNSKHVDTIEAAIVDLEEYVNKVKWLKKILKYGISSSGDCEKPQWTFMESNASFETPK